MGHGLPGEPGADGTQERGRHDHHWCDDCERDAKHYDALVKALEEIETLAKARDYGYNFGQIAHKALNTAKE